MTISPFGDSAVLINFEQIIDAKINARVVALSNTIMSAMIEGVTFCIPAYCSITVGFNPGQIKYSDLVKKINACHLNDTDHIAKAIPRKINIPVCYDEEFAIDRAYVINQTGLSWKKIIDLHTSIEYRVYMLGFIAGFAYMGTLPSPLQCSRKDTPRMNIPAGTVGIAGLQTGIYPTKAHAGWQLIGRTPIPVFDSKAKDPFLFRAGDMVRFYEIDREKYEATTKEVESGKFDMKNFVKRG